MAERTGSRALALVRSVEVEADFDLMLIEAARNAESGSLEAFAGEDRVGVVVLSGGRVAWATCRDQSENLGTFLERLGHVTAEQLAAVREEYSRNGNMKLGRLLAAAGVLSPAALRRGLMLHLRMAMSTLLRQPDLVARWQPGNIAAEEELSFPLVQLLPDWYLPHADLRPSLEGQHRSAALHALHEIPDYRGSMVVDRCGRLEEVDGFAGAPADEAATVAAMALSLLEGCPHLPSAPLGEPCQAFVECGQGALAARWLDPDRQLLVAVAVGSASRVGIAVFRLGAVAATILEAVTSRDRRDSS